MRGSWERVARFEEKKNSASSVEVQHYCLGWDMLWGAQRLLRRTHLHAVANLGGGVQVSAEEFCAFTLEPKRGLQGNKHREE